MIAPAYDVLLGYVITETVFYEDGRPPETGLLPRAHLYEDEATAERERVRAQAQANLHADLWPGEMRAYGLGVVRSPSAGYSPSVPPVLQMPAGASLQ